MDIRRAVIPAAGLGTRFLPASKAIPKEMFPVYDRPAIQYVVEEAVAAGITEILMITSPQKWPIEQHFDRNIGLEAVLTRTGKKELARQTKELAEIANIYFLSQGEQKGLGHAVLCAEKFVDGEPFALLLGDDIINSAVPAVTQLDEIREQRGGMVLAVERIPRKRISSYGVVDVKKGKRGKAVTVLDLVEKPSAKDAPSDLGIVGRYILTPEIFSELRKSRPGAGGEIQITDAIRSYLKSGGTVSGCLFDGVRYDTGDKIGLLKASIESALRDKKARSEISEYIKGLVKKGGR